MKTLPEILRFVSKDLAEIADALERTPKEVDWEARWSTYSLDAYAAVHKQYEDDNKE